MSSNIKDYSTTQASNTSLNTIDVDEGMLPSNLNNAIRALMKNTRDWYNDSQWVQYGDGDGAATVAYASGTTFTIAGVDVTTIYTVGRRIKVIAATPGTIYGTITAVAFSSNTTVTVAWDSGSLSSETIDVYLGALTAESVPKTINADRINTGVVSNTEFNYLNGVTSAIQTQLDAKQATITGSATTIDTESLTANRAVISNGSQKIAVSDVTSTELAYLDGVSSNVQTQMNTKATTSYVDDAVAGLRTRIICRAATTANIDLTADLQNGDTLDGVTLATGNKVLVKNQSTDSQNGVYIVVSSGTASRDPQFNTVAELAGQMVVVQEGTAGADKLFLCTSDNSGSIGSASITFTIITPQNTGDVTLTGTQTLTNKTLTSPKINEDVAVTSTATELNLLDGKSATNLALIGKTEGTNFTNSLLIGHTTTGTLNAAQRNIGIGKTALDALTSGDDNIALGYGAGSGVTTGTDNIGIGSYSIFAVADGTNNVGVGRQAATNTTSGDDNTAIGYKSSYFNATGSDNTALGSEALEGASGQNNSSNTAIGAKALTAVTTGNSNIGLGKDAGDNITSGSGNVIIGSINAGSATGDTQLIIADGTDGSVKWIDGDSSGNLTTTGDVTLANDKKVIFGDAGENIVGDGTNFTVASSNNFTLDAGNDVFLDAGNGNIYIQDDGTIYGHISKSGSTDFQIKSYVSDKDFKILGNDGGSQVTALTFDMSEAGAATFNSTVQATGFNIGGTAITSTAAELNTVDALSRGSLIYGNSGAATAILTKGSANQVLTSDGTDIAWQDAGGGGMGALLHTSNVTSMTSNIVIDGIFSSDYLNYLVVGTLHPATNDQQIELRYRQGGSTITDTSYRRGWNGNYTSNSSGQTRYDSGTYGDDGITIMNNISSTENTGGGNFHLYLYEPLSTDNFKNVTWHAISESPNSSKILMNLSGTGLFYGNTTALSGLDFFMASGNIKGNIKVYGLL